MKQDFVYNSPVISRDNILKNITNSKEKLIIAGPCTFASYEELYEIAVELKWNDFDSVSNIIDSHFYLLATKLRQKAVLNETEIRLCILVLIGLNRSQIANTMPYALNSIGKLKDQTAKKLGTSGKNLRNFLIKMVVDE